MLLYKPNSRNYASTAILLAMAWSSVARCQIVFLVPSTSANIPGQFSTSAEVSHTDTSALVLKCLWSEVSWV